MGVNVFLRLAADTGSFAFLGAAGTRRHVDVAIVFAVDFSSSIDPHTADLQRKGHAAALTSPQVTAAIASNYRGCIAITYFEWSSPGRGRIVLPWTRVCRPRMPKRPLA